MSSARPRNAAGRTRGSGVLMIVGVLLAALSGVLVIYVVSQATGGTKTSTITVAVANQTIVAGTPMTKANVTADFTLKAYPQALVPTNAFAVASLDQLAVQLVGQVNVVPLYSGDVYLNGDPRFKPETAFLGHSITGTNPEVNIPAGDILYPLATQNPTTPTQSFVNPGDHVDILATECSRTIVPSGVGCEAATTLQNIAVFSVIQNSIILVVTQKQALQIQLLSTDGTLTLAVRNANDSTPNQQIVVTPGSITSAFGFQ